MGEGERRSRRARAWAWMRRHAERPWFAPAVGIGSALDYVVPVVPTISLSAAVALLDPRRWAWIALWFALGSTLGGTVLAALAHALGPPALEAVLGDLTHSDGYLRAVAFLREWGPLALFALAAVPLPMRSAVVAASVAGVPPAMVALVMLPGRLVAFLLVTGMARFAPDALLRLAARRPGRRRTESPPSPPA